MQLWGIKYTSIIKAEKSMPPMTSHHTSVIRTEHVSAILRLKNQLLIFENYNDEIISGTLDRGEYVIR